MAIDAIQPIFRQIPAASAVSQISLTRRDRELQVEEGQPPMEVASAEQDALHWQKNQDLQEKWKRRRANEGSRREASSNEQQDEAQESSEEPDVEQLEPLPESTESTEQDDAGTLFEDRY